MLRAIILSTLFFMGALTAAAGIDKSGTAESLVASTAVEINSGDEEKIADAVLQALDVAAVSRFTLGRHARSLESSQVQAFTDAFEQYLRRLIVENRDMMLGADIEVTDSVQRNERDAVVTTRVTSNGEPVTLRWRVIQRKGEWSVVDLQFAGVWLAIEQRAQVSAILDRPGADIDDVIAQLH